MSGLLVCRSCCHAAVPHMSVMQDHARLYYSNKALARHTRINGCMIMLLNRHRGKNANMGIIA